MNCKYLVLAIEAQDFHPRVLAALLKLRCFWPAGIVGRARRSKTAESTLRVPIGPLLCHSGNKVLNLLNLRSGCLSIGEDTEDYRVVWDLDVLRFLRRPPESKARENRLYV